MRASLNNKTIGTAFEQEFCKLLAAEGWWVHFITPAANGSQPFDVIAVKEDKPIAVDCKTSADHIFRIDRLEDNQIMAFEMWERKGNGDPKIAVKHNDNIYLLSYSQLRSCEKIDLNKEKIWRVINEKQNI